MDDNIRSNRLKYNTISSVFLYVISIICGFILPRLILSRFGSDVNGLVSSITQFLSIISFLELGIGAVVQSSLYKPLAEKDNTLISQIIRSANRFYKRIAIILLIYVVVLIGIYPIIVSKNFGFLYTGGLIASISISFFVQYYFGVVDSLLITADQRGYIQYNAQILTLISNTIISVLLIEIGASIQIVKLASSLIFLIRPVILRRYVNRNYKIDRKIEYSVEPIKQKWNGVAQHIAAVILDQTDVIVLSVFSVLSNVSIYNVYHLVVFGVKNLVTYMTGGIRAILGEFWATQEIQKLRDFFAWSEWIIHTVVVLLFGSTASLIVPFVKIYTYGVNDANYIVPLFALLITIANAMHCLRLPYNLMILAAGHYKQTQSNYIIAAVLNIVISIVMVRYLGLIGVTIGTIIAMAYQTVWMAWYDSKNLLKIPMISFIKHICIDTICFLTAYFACGLLNTSVSTIISWLILAIKIVLIWITITGLINAIFYREFMKKTIHRFLH